MLRILDTTKLNDNLSLSEIVEIPFELRITDIVEDEGRVLVHKIRGTQRYLQDLRVQLTCS